MDILITKTINIDLELERKRLDRAFSERGFIKSKRRQERILDALERRDWKKVQELYEKLPYNKKLECPEQEFVGLWFSHIGGFIYRKSYGLSEDKIKVSQYTWK